MHAYMIKIIHNYHVQASVQIPFILDVFIAAIRLFIDINAPIVRKIFGDN